MKRDEMYELMKRSGWKPDAWGHLRMELKPQKIDGMVDVPARSYRLKFQATSVRLEKQITHPASEYRPAQKEWIRISSSYYKDLKVQDGKIPLGRGGHLLLKVNA